MKRSGFVIEWAVVAEVLLPIALLVAGAMLEKETDSTVTHYVYFNFLDDNKSIDIKSSEIMLK